MPEPRSVWDDLRGLAASVGQEIALVHETRPRPPLVCEPEEIDWDFSTPTGRMPEDMDEARQCCIHRDEWWPCQAFREGRGVQEQGPEIVQALVTRPREML